MKHGIVVDCGSIRTRVKLAREAEDAGWDGVFVSDCICIDSKRYPMSPHDETLDPWVVLAAMSMLTEHIRLGTRITPVSRRRPWKLARETVSVDHLSKGRLILSVGLGAVNDDVGFSRVNEETDLGIRAQRLDEGLSILTGLWTGKPFSYSGSHYRVKNVTFLPRPVQSPRIPIWVVGSWPKETSMRRAARWDGLLPEPYDKSVREFSPADIRRMKSYVNQRRAGRTRFDIVMGGTVPRDRHKASSMMKRFASTPVTWWIEENLPNDVNAVRKRIKYGPPHF